MKKTIQRILAMLLAAILCVSMIPASVFAKDVPEPVPESLDGAELSRVREGILRILSIGEKGTLHVMYYTLWDLGMGLEQGTVDGPLYTQTMGALRGNPAYTLSRSDGTYAAAYCLNHEKLATDDTGYTWEDLGQDRRADVIGTILAHGFQYSGKPSGEYAWGRGDSNDKWLVTQLLVWATCNGHIFIQGNHVIGFESAVDEDMKKIAPYAYNPSGFLAYYNQLKATITKSRLIPSFASYPAELDLKATAAKPIVLRWDGSKFTATVTDTNGVLANFNFRNSIPGVTCSVNGNQLTLSTDKPIPEAITSSTVSYRAQGGRGAVAVWRTNSHDSSQQDFAVYTSGYDPILAQLTVKTEGDTTQSAKLVKTSEDGKVGGITFRITGSDGSAYTKVTDSAGNIEIEELKIYDASGKPITYTATEDTPEGYEPTQPQSFTLTSGKAVVTFSNKLKRGALEVTKTSEDGLIEGVKFHLYGTSTTGQAVDMTATTDASGVARFADVPVGTGYVLEEVDTPDRYIVPANQTADIEWNTVTEKTFDNRLKRGDLTVTKTAEDGLTEGITFRLSGTSYSGIPVNETATVGKDGKAYFKNILIGSGYTLEEVDTPDRYVVPDAQTADIRWNEVTEKTFDNDLKRGDLTVTKTAEDGLTEGIKFHLSGTSLSGIAVDEYAVTDSTGKAYFNDVLIGSGYTLEEVDTPDRYIVPANQTADIQWNTVTEKNFDNDLKRGSLTVTKTAEDGLTEGLRFHLFGTSYSGLAVDEYATVGSDGKAYFRNILIGSNYTLEEVDTPDRYVVPDAQTADIRWNEVTQKSVTNILKKWNLTVNKNDSETGDPQGDASLAGATYGIFKGEELIDTYVTDTNGQFTTKYYICDDDWSIREITPSEGYLLDEASHHVGAEAKLYTVEYNSTELAVNEQVSQGKIAILKHTDDGSTQIETPETGAEFEVYLKRAGSYEAAKETERDILTCDEYGFAESKDLPYGIYTVHQISGWDGRELMADFDVFISKDGEVYHYLINNANFESYLKIVKVDAETGNPIPYAGAGFQIYRPDGSLVTQTFTYPEITTIDTFYTTDEGFLITPQALEYGTGYSLVEVAAPYGYVLDSDPVYFDITQDNSSEENAVTVVKVVMEDMPQKGTISIGKTGEIFSSVTESDGVYQPVYSVQGLPGAVYEITAAEDIVTLDGTVRYTAGELVDTVTTDETGSAKSKALYLGKYTVTETKAPDGMVLNAEPHTVELTYAGQDVELTETATDFVNDRQKVSVSLRKIMEQDKPFGIGQGDEILSVLFGLYAAEDITAADGTAIPKDGLIEIVSVDENGNASICSDLPFGSYYLKEIATDSHYILSDAKYPIGFEYAGQDTALVEIQANKGNAIDNELIYGTIQGLKIDRETEDKIAGAVFGLFAPDVAEYTEDNAILTAKSGEDGVFTFERVPFGSWTVVELSPAEGYLPNTEPHHVHVTTDGEVIEFTAVNDKIPELHTTATTDEGKDAHPSDRLIIEDVVEYTHLVPGKEYKVVGTLMDKATGKEFVVDGHKVLARAIFTPEQPSGSVTVTFSFDATGLALNTDIVVFENLYKDGKEIAVHADIKDEGQTVTVLVPEIGTTATADGEKQIHPDEEILIEDVVEYQNLIPGKEYILKGVLMDKSTGEAFLVDERPVMSEVTFVPDALSGTVTVTFVFNGSEINKNTDLVVFESLYHDSKELAVHADIEDEGQTVTVLVPEIGTTATSEGDKLIHPDEEIVIEDVAEYQNLIPGKEYILKGVLMDKATGEAFLVDGKQVVAETTFIPTAPSGTVTATFAFDGSGIQQNTELVVFERLYHDSKELAVHADIKDEGQTVTVLVPKIETTATSEGEKLIHPDEEIVIEDVVEYQNLIPGKEYKVVGTLMDKATGEAFLVDGKQVVSETTFIPTEPSGTVTVTFVFDGSGIKQNTDLVVFESLYHDSKELAVHADIEDEGQTVTVLVPEIGTTATADGKKEVEAQGEITIEDIVSYTNLIPGKEYTLSGVLMNKASGKPLTVDDKEIRSEVTFTPETADGEVTVQFTFDAAGLTTATEVVVVETLYREGVEIAVHADLEDEDQTVKLTPPVPPTPNVPDTGDSGLEMWLVLFISALLGAAVYLLRPERKHTKKTEMIQILPKRIK